MTTDMILITTITIFHFNISSKFIKFLAIFFGRGGGVNPAWLDQGQHIGELRIRASGQLPWGEDSKKQVGCVEMEMFVSSNYTFWSLEVY